MQTNCTDNLFKCCTSESKKLVMSLIKINANERSLTSISSHNLVYEKSLYEKVKHKKYLNVFNVLEIY